MGNNISTRMGDGQFILMSPAQVKEDILAGTKDAADRGKIPELTPAEQEYLFEIIADKNKIVGVERGEEIVLSDDVTVIRNSDDEGAGGGIGLPMSRQLQDLVHERAYCQDCAMFGTPAGANVPEIKAELNTEMQAIETTQLLMTAPLLYGCAPALLWYFKPLGPFENPADILPQGKIKESCEALEGAADALTDDIVYLGKKAALAGADGFNFDTTAASGDAEFYGVLNAVQELKEAVPELGIEVGMAAEFVLGLHGKITFNGQRLAGLYPHDQVKVAEAAGVDIFGPVVNTNCSRSFPWNISRAVTFVKETSAVSGIPIHPNVGMGVGGVPMYPVPPIDCVTRVAKAIIQIGKADGL